VYQKQEFAGKSTFVRKIIKNRKELLGFKLEGLYLISKHNPLQYKEMIQDLEADNIPVKILSYDQLGKVSDDSIFDLIGTTIAIFDDATDLVLEGSYLLNLISVARHKNINCYVIAHGLVFPKSTSRNALGQARYHAFIGLFGKFKQQVRNFLRMTGLSHLMELALSDVGGTQFPVLFLDSLNRDNHYLFSNIFKENDKPVVLYHEA